MDGVEVSRRARTWWQTAWSGETFIAAGANDPVLGIAAMQRLRTFVRDAPAPVEYGEAGHFIQEWGEDVARDALAAFGGR
jgi:predicted esterase